VLTAGDETKGREPETEDRVRISGKGEEAFFSQRRRGGEKR
jgi:hypothetical protein